MSQADAEIVNRLPGVIILKKVLSNEGWSEEKINTAVYPVVQNLLNDALVIGDFMMPDKFKKYRGKTYAEVAKENPQYLKWMMGLEYSDPYILHCVVIMATAYGIL